MCCYVILSSWDSCSIFIYFPEIASLFHYGSTAHQKVCCAITATRWTASIVQITPSDSCALDNLGIRSEHVHSLRYICSRYLKLLTVELVETTTITSASIKFLFLVNLWLEARVTDRYLSRFCGSKSCRWLSSAEFSFNRNQSVAFVLFVWNSSAACV